MATTTPDNVRSPNPTDPYNLVADLAILASDVQTALTRRANLYVGTAAQRTAFTTAPDGVHWQDTNSNRWEWVRTGGTWVVVDPSASGEVTVTVPAATTTGSQNVSFASGLFATAPAVSVESYSPLALTSSLTWRVTNRTTTGFTIEFRREAGPSTSATFGWIAR